MTEREIQLLQWAVGTFVVALLWSLRTAIKGGYWLKTGESITERLGTFIDDTYKPFVDEVHGLFEQAGAKMSTLASTVQGLPDRLRRENDDRYMSKQISEERWAEARRHTDSLDERIRELEIAQAERRGNTRR